MESLGGGHAALIGQIEKELDGAEKAVGHLVTAIAEAGHSSAMLARLSEKEAERDRLRVSLFEAKEAQAAYRIPELTREDFDKIAANTEELLEKAGMRRRQIFYRGIIESIVVENVGAARNSKLEGEIRVRPLWEGAEGKVLYF